MPTTRAEAERLMREGQLPRVVRELAMDLTHPIFWYRRTNDPAKGQVLHHGSTFFVRPARTLFGVTANHVAQKLIEDQAREPTIQAQVGGGLIFRSFAERVISRDQILDICTYSVSDEELRKVSEDWRNVTVHSPPDGWPPPPPERGRGVFVAAPPKEDRIEEGNRTANFGYRILNVGVEDVSNASVVLALRPDDCGEVPGIGQMPFDANLAGFSGAPLFAVVERSSSGLFIHRLAGVVVEQWPVTTEDNVIVAARLDAIDSEGRIHR